MQLYIVIEFIQISGNQFKMKQLSFFQIFAVALITCSCTTLKRYDSVQSSGTDNNLANIDLFGFEVSRARPETGIRTLWDLSADAQSQFIKILNSRFPDNEKFIKALSYEYLKPNTALIPDDYTSRDMRMVFSVSKRLGFGERNSPPGFNLSPADRIEYLKISLTLPENPGVKFKSWNMFTTDYGSINIADVSFSRNLEIDASGLISAGNKVAAEELSAAGKSSTTRKEDQGLQYRYLRLNGKINNKSIELEEEGTREIDLTGNIMADVRVEFDRFPEMLTEISGLKDSTGHFNASEKLLLLNSETFIPDMKHIKDTIFADLRMDYLFRNVLKGQKTFPEWDDRVKYVKGRVSKRIPILTSSDYVPEFYCIGTNMPPNERKVIKLTASGNREYDVIFDSRAEATAFYDWMVHYFSQLPNKGKQLKIGEFVLRFADSDLTNDVFFMHAGLKVMPCYQ
jgi:hypothetical protein